MSCPDGATLLLYADAELVGEELQTLQSHLVLCRDCREHVVALRDESRLLGGVLTGRERRARSAAPARAPEPGVAIGLPLAVAAVAAALAFLGFLLETRMPGGLDLMNPLRLVGAYEMAFDLIFLLRDRVPGLLELAASIGAVAGVSAILTFAVGALYRHVFPGSAALVLLALASAGPADALRVHLDEDVQVPADETVEESMLVSADLAYVAGVIVGDLIVAAERVTIAGTVKGNLYVLSRELEITGRVEGSLHGIVEDTRIDGAVEGSVYQLGENVTLARDGSVGRDLSMVGKHGTVEGVVGRDVVFGGGRLELRSQVGRDVEARFAEHVALRDAARIGGDVDASLADEENLVRAPGAQVAGAVRVTPRRDAQDHYLAAYRDPWLWALHGIGFVAAFGFGLLLRFLLPLAFARSLDTGADFLRSLGWGFVAIVATPIAIVLTALTVVGIPVAVLALFVYVVLVYAAEIVVGAWLGRVLLPPRDEGIFAFGRSFFVGLAVLTVAGHLPFLGPPVLIVATLIGAGMLFLQARSAALGEDGEGGWRTLGA